MVLIDAYAREAHFVDHIAPIWRALGEHAGQFHVARPAQAAAAGLPNVTSAPLQRGAGRPILTVAYGDMSEARQMGRVQLALGQHGAGQSYHGAGGRPNPSHPGGPHHDGVGLFLVPNATAARLTHEAYPAARVVTVGCPKLDVLPARQLEGPRPVVAISVHWDARVSPEARGAWGDYRTVLLQLARTYRVLGHGHPRIIDRLAPYYRASHIEVVKSFAAVLARADLYVCDNSSSLFEFAASGRPVVVLNAKTYRLAADHGLRFAPSDGCPITAGRHFCGASHVGPQVNEPRQLAPAVARALELLPGDVAARERALAHVYEPRRGGAALAAQALVEWAS